MLAADAVRRVGQLLHARGVDRRIDTVEKHRIRHGSRKGCAERIVRIERQLRMGAVFNADADVFQRMRDLAVAVELVAEHVRDDDGLRIDKFADGLERGLVRLDQRMGIAAFSAQAGMDCKLGGDAAEQICAGLVGKIRDSGFDPRLLDHTRGRGLAVGTRDDHRRHVLCQHAEQIGAELQGDAPRKVGPAPSQQADHPAAELAGENGYRNSNIHVDVIAQNPAFYNPEARIYNSALA